MVSQVVLFSDDSNLTSDSFLIFVKMPENDRFALSCLYQSYNYSLHQWIHITRVSVYEVLYVRKRQMKWYLLKHLIVLWYF